jgi:hypothetical protein
MIWDIQRRSKIPQNCSTVQHYRRHDEWKIMRISTLRTLSAFAKALHHCNTVWQYKSMQQCTTFLVVADTRLQSQYSTNCTLTAQLIAMQPILDRFIEHRSALYEWQYANVLFPYQPSFRQRHHYLRWQAQDEPCSYCWTLDDLLNQSASNIIKNENIYINKLLRKQTIYVKLFVPCQCQFQWFHS